MYKCSLFLFVAFLWAFTGILSGFSQEKKCPSCTADINCVISPAFPVFCPSNFPDGMVGTFYNEVVSYWMPNSFVDPQTSKTMKLLEFELQSLSKLPAGFTFNTDIFPKNTYYPSSGIAQAEYGCMRIAGQPDKLYNDSITMNIRMLLQNDIGDHITKYMKFKIPLNIKMGVITKDGLTVYNPTGCAPLNVNFKANNISNGSPNYKYHWDFGNGVTDTLEIPASQIYNAAGTYKVILETRIDTFYISQFDILSSSCTDPTSNPDFYIRIWKGGSELLNTKYFPYEAINNKAAPLTIKFRPLMLGHYIYGTELLDDDLDQFISDDTCGSTSFNGYSTGIYTRQIGSSVVRFEIAHGKVLYRDTIDVVVANNPPTPHLYYVTRDSVCMGDSIHLSTSMGYTYEWYHLGSQINAASSNAYFASLDGDYVVKTTGGNACSSFSDPSYLYFIDVPAPIISKSPDGTYLIADSTHGNNLQWFLDDNLIPNANQNQYTPQASGYYHVMAFNYLGCKSVSDTIYMNSISTKISSFVGNDREYEILPNPSSGNFVLKFSSKEEIPISVTVKDIYGRILEERFLNTDKQSISLKFDLTSEKKGFYFVVIQNPNECRVLKVILY